jgi:hypothetical protein
MSLHEMIGTKTLTIPGNSFNCMPWLIRPFARGFGFATAADGENSTRSAMERIVTRRRTATRRGRAVAGREPIARR